MASKAKTNLNLSRDLFVKLSNLFNDCYIVNMTYVVAGENPSDRILGTALCIIEPTYRDALVSLLKGMKKDCIYVKDITEIKKWMQNLLDESPDDYEVLSDDTYKLCLEDFIKDDITVEQGKELKKQIETIEEKFASCNSRWWSCIADNEEALQAIFASKAIFDYPLAVPNNDTTESETEKIGVSVSKQLLPLVDQKNVRHAYIGTNGTLIEGAPDIMEVMVDFRFTHFRMMLLYNVIVLPWEPSDDGYTEISGVLNSDDENEE
jgi:hypothetical protein